MIWLPRCLRKRLYDEAGIVKEEEDNCPICLDPMRTGDITTLPCGHTFHAKCIMANVLHNQSRCPMCRHTFSRCVEDLEEEEDSGMNQDLIIAVACRIRCKFSKKDVCTMLSRFDLPLRYRSTIRKRELCMILAEQILNETDDEE